jgi:putative spermidine/putrescine transport system permease protein
VNRKASDRLAKARSPAAIPPRHYAAILIPATALVLLFAIPFANMVAISFFRPVPGGFYEPIFTLDNYRRFLTPFFTNVLGFSFFLAALVAVCSVSIAFPFTYLLTRSGRAMQVCWLVFFLAILSLSEVIIGFAWGTLLSQTAGVTNLLVAVGLMEKPVSLTPSFGALLVALVYQALPYSVLILYPSLSRLDSSLAEAARTLGASPIRTFFDVTVPSQRRAIVATTVMVFVFSLGSYLLPQMLGRPQHWTLSVLITDQSIMQSNLPFAAAMAIFLVALALILVGLVTRLGKERASAR